MIADELNNKGKKWLLLLLFDGDCVCVNSTGTYNCMLVSDKIIIGRSYMDI